MFSHENIENRTHSYLTYSLVTTCIFCSTTYISTYSIMHLINTPPLYRKENKQRFLALEYILLSVIERPGDLTLSKTVREKIALWKTNGCTLKMMVSKIGSSPLQPGGAQFQMNQPLEIRLCNFSLKMYLLI